MRLETEVDLFITIKYDKWKMIEDHMLNYTPRRCSLSYETDDTEQKCVVETEELETPTETKGCVVDTEITDTSNEIEFIEVTYV